MSKNIYFIAPYPKGKAPSQRFRFEQYLELLEKEGYSTTVLPFIDKKTWNTIYKEGNVFSKAIGMLKSFGRRWKLLFQLKNVDYIFIHREMAQIGPPLFEWIVAKILRKKYIYDFDDAIWLPNYSTSNARFHRLKAYWKVNYCMKWAHHITAGNSYLADYARKFNKNVSVIPTTIDTENWHNKTIDYTRKSLTIGWTGTHTTMRYLDDLIPILQNLEKEYTFTFRVISNEKPSYDLQSLEFVQWNKNTEVEDLLAIDIGVMPLHDESWSVGKCGFKALQYMALGIPTVASPIGVNTTIIQHEKNGFLASTSKEWERELRSLLENESQRKQIGQKGQERVRNSYSVTATISKYLSLFKSN